MGAVKRTHPESRAWQQEWKRISRLEQQYDVLYGKGSFDKMVSDWIDKITQRGVNEDRG